MLTTGQLNFNRNCEDDVRFSHRIGDGKAISKDDQHHSHSHLNVYRTNIRCVFFMCTRSCAIMNLCLMKITDGEEK